MKPGPRGGEGELWHGNTRGHDYKCTVNQLLIDKRMIDEQMDGLQWIHMVN